MYNFNCAFLGSIYVRRLGSERSSRSNVQIFVVFRGSFGLVGESHSRGGSSLVGRGISLVEETLHRVLSLLVTSLESLKAI